MGFSSFLCCLFFFLFFLGPIFADRGPIPCFVWCGESNICRDPAGTDNDEKRAGEDYARQDIRGEGRTQ